MPRVVAGNKHLLAARTGDAAWRRVLPSLLPLDEIAVRALVDALGSGTTGA